MIKTAENIVELAGISLPGALSLDYSDPEEVYAYCRLWSVMCMSAGAICDRKPDTQLMRSVRREGRIWMREVEHQFAEWDIPWQTGIISPYDFVHRIVCGFPDYRKLRDFALHTIDRWLAGDTSDSKTRVVLMLGELLAAGCTSLEHKYLQYYFSATGRWLTELIDYGSFRQCGQADVYRRLCNLLPRDLSVYVQSSRQTGIKREWAQTYWIDDLSRLTTAELEAYIPFARMAAGIVPAPTLTEPLVSVPSPSVVESALHTELSRRCDRHPLLRCADTLSLRLNLCV